MVPGTCFCSTVWHPHRLPLFTPSYFATLNAIAENNAWPALLTPTNAPHLRNLLQSLTQGITTVPDAGVKKTCFSTLCALLGDWLPNGPSAGGPATPLSPAVLEDLRQFIFDALAPITLNVVVTPEFVVTDAGYSGVCAVIIKLQLLLLSRTPPAPGGKSLADHFLSTVFPALGVSVDVGGQYLRALQDNAKTPRSFRPWFAQLAKQLRTSRGLP